MKLRISAWGIRNPIPVAILFVCLTIWGLMSYGRLPIKQFPNISFPIVVVSVAQFGASPSEMENQITRPIENALSTVQNVKHIVSSVVLGVSTTSLEFELGSDLQKATDDVRTAVDQVRVQLPNGIDPPQVQRVDVDSSPILTVAVSSPTLSVQDLSWFVDDTVARTLQAQKGVAQVGRIGGADREIQVILDPDRMASFGVTANQVSQALRSFNSDNSGGRVEVGGQEQTIRVLGQARTVDQLRQTTIPVGGRYVRLADIAEVGDGVAEARGFARLDGRSVVAFQVNKTRDASEVSTETGVKDTIDKLQKAHPEVKFREVVSTVRETRESFHATQDVLLEGMALAALVVFLFLRNWRATLITAIAMPLALIPTFGFMALMHFSLNVITLLALTLVIGILVDDAIVEIENIEKRIEAGESPYRASLIGADSIGLAVVATTATIVVVFLPVSFMGGIPGQFFREFGLTVAVAVLFSLLVARLLTPLMSAYLLKPARHPRPRPAFKGWYRNTLEWALEHKWLSALAGGLIFVGSLALTTLLPVGFQPVDNSGLFYLQVEGPPGASRPDMEKVVAHTTATLKAQNDVESVFAQIGSSSGGGFGGGGGGGSELRTGTVTVKLKAERSMSTEAFKLFIRPKLREIPDARVTTQSDFGAADVDIVLSSEDAPALERAQSELMREMRPLTVVSNVRPSPAPPGPELVIRPKPAEAARLAVNAEALAQIVRIATIGDIDANVSKFSEGKRRIPIRVKLPESARSDLSVIERLKVPVTGGGVTSLASVADLSFQAGPARIARYMRERRASVQADLNGTTIGQAMGAITKLPAIKNLPPTVRRAQVGQSEQLAEVVKGFTTAVFTGVALIFAVLVLLFRSFFKPATILSALPLSIGGAFLGLLVTHQAITMPVFIGVLMLLGLAAKNSILLVEFAIEDERAGQDRKTALMNACRERARPIVMTTVAMAAGMLPTALALGEGSYFRQPMAIAVIGGLISSTALSLVLVPVVYEIVDQFENWFVPLFGRFVTKRRPGDDAPIREDEETLVTDATVVGPRPRSRAPEHLPAE